MADLRSRLHIELRSLVLKGVEETGTELGRGAYGVVVEVKLHGLLFAGKKLHEALLQDSRQGKGAYLYNSAVVKLEFLYKNTIKDNFSAFLLSSTLHGSKH